MATPLDDAEWGNEPVGTRTVTLDASVTPDTKTIGWMPGHSAVWLVDRLWQRLGAADWKEPILGRYFLEGWAVPTLKPGVCRSTPTSTSPPNVDKYLASSPQTMPSPAAPSLLVPAQR